MIVELEAFRALDRSGRNDEVERGSDRRGLRVLEDDLFRGRPPPS